MKTKSKKNTPKKTFVNNITRYLIDFQVKQLLLYMFFMTKFCHGNMCLDFFIFFVPLRGRAMVLGVTCGLTIDLIDRKNMLILLSKAITSSDGSMKNINNKNF